MDLHVEFGGLQHEPLGPFLSDASQMMLRVVRTDLLVLFKVMNDLLARQMVGQWLASATALA